MTKSWPIWSFGTFSITEMNHGTDVNTFSTSFECSGRFRFYAPRRFAAGFKWHSIHSVAIQTEFGIKTKIDRDFNTKKQFRIGPLLFVAVFPNEMKKHSFIRSHINDKKWLILWSNWLWQIENVFSSWHVAALPVSILLLAEMLHVFL